MMGIDRPDKVSTGSNFGDIASDIGGGVVGFIENPLSAGAKLPKISVAVRTSLLCRTTSSRKAS